MFFVLLPTRESNGKSRSSEVFWSKTNVSTPDSSLLLLLLLLLLFLIIPLLLRLGILQWDNIRTFWNMPGHAGQAGRAGQAGCAGQAGQAGQVVRAWEPLGTCQDRWDERD